MAVRAEVQQLGLTLEMGEVTTGDPAATRETFSLDAEYKAPGFVNWRVPLLQLPVPMARYLSAVDLPLSEDGDLEIPLAPSTLGFRASIDLPGEWTAQVPESVVIREDFAEYRVTSRFEGRTASVERVFETKVERLPESRASAFDAFVARVKAVPAPVFVLTSAAAQPPMSKPADRPGSSPAAAVRVGGQIKEPRKLKDVRPVYPEAAKQARVQGAVVLECTIDPEGKVTNVRVVESVPPLDQAAIDAVSQWVYVPTLLNGVPTPVIMTVTVNFRLSTGETPKALPDSNEAAACDKGDASACARLGHRLWAGTEVEKDEARAVALFGQGCQGKFAPACTALAWAYELGRGVGRDDKKASDFYRQACDGGSAGGCLRLGYLYEEGRGVARDLAQARKRYKEACHQQQLEACSALASLYAQSSDDKDKSNTAPLFRQACTGGFAAACRKLGFLMERGEGVPKDLAQAADLYRRACDGGDGWGCTNLGSLYARGGGVPKDDARAMELHRKACDMGAARGCTDLGAVHENGRGVERSVAKAAELYTKACAAQDMVGCVSLGLLYANGNGVPKDPGRARELFERACKGGYPPGCDRLNRSSDPER
jgi:TonB family protein